MASTNVAIQPTSFFNYSTVFRGWLSIGGAVPAGFAAGDDALSLNSILAYPASAIGNANNLELSLSGWLSETVESGGRLTVAYGAGDSAGSFSLDFSDASRSSTLGRYVWSGQAAVFAALGGYATTTLAATATLSDTTAAPDTTPPSPTGQTTNAAGTAVTIAFNEALDAGSTPPASAFTLSPARTISAVTVSGSDVTLTLSAAYAHGDTITVAYAKPSSNPIQDVAGNDAASFAAQGVTNNVPAPAATLTVIVTADNDTPTVGDTVKFTATASGTAPGTTQYIWQEIDDEGVVSNIGHNTAIYARTEQSAGTVRIRCMVNRGSVLAFSNVLSVTWSDPPASTRERTYYLRAASEPAAPSAAGFGAWAAPGGGWSTSAPDATSGEAVYAVTLTQHFDHATTQTAATFDRNVWSAVTLHAAALGTSTRERTYYLRAASEPAAPSAAGFGAWAAPGGGWSTSAPDATSGEAVYAVTLTQHFDHATTQTAATFDRNDWSAVTLHAAALGASARPIHPDTLAALAKSNATLVMLVDIDWPGGSLRRTDAGAAVTDRSRDPDEIYTPTREILDVGEIVETAEPRANTVRISLDATPAEVGAVLSGPVGAWRVRIAWAALDAAGEIVGAPIPLLAGSASGEDIRASRERSTIDLEVSSVWAAWRVTRGRKTSTESQQAHYPGDRGFDYAGLETGDLSWGKA